MMEVKETSRRFVKAMTAIIGENVASGKKYSRVDFADSIGYSRTNICKVAALTREPGKKMLDKICAVHKINRKWLMTGQGEMRKTEDALDKRVAKLEKRVRKLEKLVKKKAAH